MPQQFTRFMPVLLQIGSPLKVDVYENDPATRAPRVMWSRGHVFMPTDLAEILNPMRRFLVLQLEHDAALKELEATPLETESQSGMNFSDR